MAKRPQVSLNLPVDVYEWFLDLEIKRNCTKTQLGLAGLVLLGIAKREERELAMSMAGYLDRDLLTWVEIARLQDSPADERDKPVRELTEKAFARHLSGEAASEYLSRISGKGSAATEAVVDAASKKPKPRRRRKGA